MCLLVYFFCLFAYLPACPTLDYESTLFEFCIVFLGCSCAYGIAYLLRRISPEQPYKCRNGGLCFHSVQFSANLREAIFFGILERVWMNFGTAIVRLLLLLSGANALWRGGSWLGECVLFE